MALQIRKPADARYIKACIFAPAGAGKTVLLGTAALDKRTAPCLGLDFEGGTESLAGLDIDVARIASWEDFNEAYELLASGDSGYNSVFIDSISEVHKFALLDILEKQGPTRKDPDLLEQRDYGTATVQMRRLLRKFRDLQMHVFFSAHSKEVEIPREGRVRIPDLAGQMAEEVSGIVSVQGYLAQFEEDGVLHRTVLLHSFPKFRIKARTPFGVEAPEELVDPTISDLLDSLGYGSDAEFEAKGSSRGKELVNDDDDRKNVEEQVEEELEKKDVVNSSESSEDEDNADGGEDVDAPSGEEDEDADASEPDAEEDIDLEHAKGLKISDLRVYADKHGAENAERKTRGVLIRFLTKKAEEQAGDEE